MSSMDFSRDLDLPANAHVQSMGGSSGRPGSYQSREFCRETARDCGGQEASGSGEVPSISCAMIREEVFPDTNKGNVP
jgi:hypothetical protein